MSAKAKLGIAATLMFAFAVAPALGCVIYMAQATTAHKCCPQEKPQSAELTRCCVYSPAITAQSTDAAVPMIAASAFVASEPTASTSSLERIVIPSLDTSPPGGSSILRI